MDDRRQNDLAARLLAVSAAGAPPLTVSGETGAARTVADRVRDARAAAPAPRRGSCRSPWNSWSD
ncbi:hypothetical protein [Actinomadura sp. WAC 06369]|uniref:hypothetical protein n=1 Tax=Actinomadura sp. WAC 06369 TaxID=2203193 RepID=UPI000F7668E4|nr:hypothetical protein [Actinomadura sp. WAC 06369]RSN62026.1 hypothetical protein DMH08_19995 [Actinomadura sp. WAC 06369]